MKRPRVSIVIPCFNAEPWLAAALDSAFAQRGVEFEVVAIDDGSTDGSREILRRYEPRGLRLLEQPNRGASAARNAGLRATHGDFIQFLDADDLLAPDKIERQLARADGESPLTARWGRFVADPKAAWFRANPLNADLPAREYLERYAREDCMMHPAAWLLPRTLVDRVGPWDERLSLNDDGEYFTRVVTHSKRILHCPDAVSYYRSLQPTSLSAQRSATHLASAHLAATLVAQHMVQFEDSPAMRLAAANILQRFAYDYFPAAPALVANAERAARELGGAQVQPLGGNTFSLVRRMVGWKFARRLQSLAGKAPGAAPRE